MSSVSHHQSIIGSFKKRWLVEFVLCYPWFPEWKTEVEGTKGVYNGPSKEDQDSVLQQSRGETLDCYQGHWRSEGYLLPLEESKLLRQAQLWAHQTLVKEHLEPIFWDDSSVTNHELRKHLGLHSLTIRYLSKHQWFATTSQVDNRLTFVLWQ